MKENRARLSVESDGSTSTCHVKRVADDHVAHVADHKGRQLSISVAVGLGAIAFTTIPYGNSLSAVPKVNPLTAHLEI